MKTKIYEQNKHLLSKKKQIKDSYEDKNYSFSFRNYYLEQKIYFQMQHFRKPIPLLPEYYSNDIHKISSYRKTTHGSGAFRQFFPRIFFCSISKFCPNVANWSRMGIKNSNKFICISI